jgi:hypothetical protein
MPLGSTFQKEVVEVWANLAPLEQMVVERITADLHSTGHDGGQRDIESVIDGKEPAVFGAKAAASTAQPETRVARAANA